MEICRSHFSLLSSQFVFTFMFMFGSVRSRSNLNLNTKREHRMQKRERQSLDKLQNVVVKESACRP
jgi:hypothetical protein